MFNANSKFTPAIAGLLLGALGSLSTQAADPEAHWPQWRGPNGNGIAPDADIPTQWSETENIVWKREIPGQGHGTPVIWGERLFVLSAVPTGKNVEQASVDSQTRRWLVAAQQEEPQRGFRPRGPGGFGGQRGRGFGRGGGQPTEIHDFTTYCLDRHTGETIWSRVGVSEVPAMGVQPSNRFSAASAVTDGERVYSYFGGSGLYCYDMDGEPLWNKQYEKHSVTFGEATSPALHGETLVLLRDTNGPSFIAAYNAKTGDELWRKERDEGSGWTTPYFLDVDGTTQVIVSGSSAIVAYDLASGSEIWTCSGLGSNPIPMIVADESTIYAMSGHRSPAAIAIPIGGEGDVTSSVKWTLNRGVPYVPSPLLYQGLLFFTQRTDARLTCVDPETGEAFYSQEDLPGAGGVYGSPIGVNGHIYLASQNGATAVLENGKALKVLAINELDDGFDASPVIAGDKLYLRGRQNLYCIGTN